MKLKTQVRNIRKVISTSWTKNSFATVWQNFANLATAFGLIWAIFTYNKGQIESAEKDAANLRELARIQKKDSLQLSLLKAQYSAAIEEKDWARYKDRILIEYAKRNLDTISSTSHKALTAHVEASRQYLSSFNEVYRNIIDLQGQQTRLQERAFTMQERINTPLLEVDSLNITRTTYYFQDKEVIVKLEGVCRLINLGSVTIRDLKAELLTLSYGHQDISFIADTSSLVKTNGIFGNSIHWTNSGISAGKSKLAPFSCVIVLKLPELPKIIRSKFMAIVSATNELGDQKKHVYTSAFEIVLVKRKGTDYAHEVFNNPSFSEYELKLLERQTNMLSVESLDKYGDRAFHRQMNKLNSELERSKERLKLQQKVYEDIKKSLLN